eukprot:m.19849 g.19849  ORF g.19849 m.19849 type:complete len:500 (+) comp5494_c0_seq1:88-1587(+)
MATLAQPSERATSVDSFESSRAGSVEVALNTPPASAEPAKSAAHGAASQRTEFEEAAAALDLRMLRGETVGGEWAKAEADAHRVGDATALRDMRQALWCEGGLLADRGYLPKEPGYLPPEAVSGWKLLRFLRGNGGSVPKALEAYEKMLRFRDEGRVAEFRAALVESAGCSPDAPIDQIVKTMVWPYFHPKFSDLVEQAWGPDEASPEVGVPPVVQVGSDPETGSPITWTAFERYNFPKIASTGLGPMWMELVQWCDVYFDLLLHARSEERGTLVRRRDVVDIQNVGLSALSGGGLALLRKMESLTIHYPECIGHTDMVNFGSVGVALWSAASMLLPKATREKFSTHNAGHLAESLGFPASVLPRRLGGTSNDFTPHLDALFLPRDVPARGTVAVRHEVVETDVGAPVEWEVIGLGVLDGWAVRVGIEFFTKPSPEASAAGYGAVVVVGEVATPKINSIRDSWIPEAPGSLSITVYNDSMIQSKHVSFRIRKIGTAAQS